VKTCGNSTKKVKTKQKISSNFNRYFIPCSVIPYIYLHFQIVTKTYLQNEINMTYKSRTNGMILCTN